MEEQDNSTTENTNQEIAAAPNKKEESKSVLDQSNKMVLDTPNGPGGTLPEDKTEDKHTGDFINKLNTGQASLGLSPSAQQKVGDYLIDIRRRYADAALRVKALSPDSPEYQEHVATMNGVNRAVQTLAAQTDAYKQNQVDYIKDFDNNLISNSDKINGKAGVISELYRGDLDLNIGDDGTMHFGKDGQYVPYSTIADHSVKDFNTADKILKLTNDVYKSKMPLNPDRKALVMNQVQSLIKQGGRDSILSLITDGLIPGFEHVKVPEELYQPGNAQELEKFFLDKVSTGIEASAQAGYDDHTALENSKHSRGLDYNLAKMQQTYDFRQSHPSTRGSGSSGGTSSTTTPKGYTSANSSGEAWKILESTPGKKIKMPGGATYISGKEKDAQGRYPITIEGNNNRVDYGTFKKHA